MKNFFILNYFIFSLIFLINTRNLRKIKFPKKIDKTKNIYILQWSNLWAKEKYYLRCPLYKECKYSSSFSDVKKADVLIFKDLTSDENHIPKYRNPKQLYVYMNMEPKLVIDRKEILGYKWRHKNFFNMTYTYSLKSDIQDTYYGKWVNKPTEKRLSKYYKNVSTIPKMKDLKQKKRYIIWTVSDCTTASKREIAVDMLKKYIPVNQYGLCNNRYLNYDRSSKEFRKKYEEHFFYIALENSNCEDYITEKYFSRVHFNSIPIVGYRKYYQNIAPNNSFIAIDDFNSPKEMANFLYFLIKNKNEYLKYFEYRKEGWKVYNIDNASDNFCSLCKKLVEMKKSGQLEKYHKIYYDAREEFLSWTQCQESQYFWEKWINSSKTTKKNKRKKSSKGKKSNDKKVDEIKQTSFSTAHQGKTEIILNAQPQDIEKYINDKEGGDEIIEQVVKALEKKKQEKSDMRKYKHWLDFIEQKQ
ncbi:Alpha-(1,3)-fucosyltransferase C [Strongyloides ratti]|uniref:Fucosyltransferase n=1 Tax=Strongyloides ratti TaxID=34506 RepID=A0A090MWN6_STRRB|nr:Alpha-(1,3)-fucosyltransferase C [Strongyloides ratti]CEF63999.1 Alpha-(1,3)-fucosyltransferase C [Strongyloides ratti]